jgi:transposase-like protein
VFEGLLKQPFRVQADTVCSDTQGQSATSKYLNNTIEQDHRRVKHRLGPMLGLKSFRTAAVVISSIELAEKIKKGQFQIGKLGGPTATMPEIWRAAVAP